jgi:hypothetical protein
LIGCKTDLIQAASAVPPKTTTFKGRDFFDWDVALGDGVYAAPGLPSMISKQSITAVTVN